MRHPAGRYRISDKNRDHQLLFFLVQGGLVIVFTGSPSAGRLLEIIGIIFVTQGKQLPKHTVQEELKGCAGGKRSHLVTAFCIGYAKRDVRIFIVWPCV